MADDDEHWLPITYDESTDGQEMVFPDLTPSPTPPTTPLPSISTAAPTQNAWCSLINDHASLLSSQATMDRRKFNKSVMALLNKAIILAKEHINSSPHSMQQLWPDPRAMFGEFRLMLLNDKEMASEDMVEKIVNFVQQSISPLLTADERKEELQKKSVALLQDLSPQMSIKFTPIIKSYIARQFGSDMDDMLAEICLPEMSLKEKTSLYTRMLTNFLDDVGCLSFAFSNRRLLGNVTPVDLWFLTFFAFVTARRCRGDNLLMLGCVGMTLCHYQCVYLCTALSLTSMFYYRQKFCRKKFAL